MTRTSTTLAILLLLTLSASGQTLWSGLAGDSDWSNPANWSPMTVPTPTTFVVIPSGTATSPSTAGVVAAVGNIQLQAGASLTIAAGSPLIASGFVTIDGQLAGGGLLRMVGNGNLTASQPIPNVELDGTGQQLLVAPLTITGDLTLLNGTTGPAGSGSIVVGGNATFSGGTVTFFANAPIDVAGDVTFNGATCSFSPTFRVGGDWSSDTGYATTSNGVTFDGSTPQSLSAAGSMSNVIVDPGADVSISSGLAARTLVVNGIFRCMAPLDIALGVTVNATATLDLGGLTNSVGGAFSVTGALTNPGTLIFDGSGAVASTAPLGDVTTTGSNVTLAAPLMIGGDLLQTGGQVAPVQNGIIDIAGTATFSGGTLTFFSAAVFDVAGDVTFNGTTCTASPNFRCAANWTSDTGYFSNFSTVIFDGSSPQTISASGSRFNRIEVAPGADATIVTGVNIGPSVVVDGDLTLAGSMDDEGTCTVNAAATLDFGGLAHSIGGAFTVTGTLANVGPLDFDGSGTINPGGRALADVTFSGTGSKTVTAPVTITGDLAITGGTFGVNGTGAIAVAGNATCSGGSMTFFSSAIVDVAGDVTFSGTTATSPPTIHCAGSWVSDANFNSSFSTVRLDAVGTQSFSAPGTTFNRLEIGASSVVVSTNGLHCRGLVTVDGRLDANSFTDLDNALVVNGILVAAATLDVEGACTVAPAGTLDLGGLAHSFGAAFDIDGTLQNVALITFDNTGGPVTLAAGNALDDVVVSPAGTTNFGAPCSINGDLTQTSGTVAVSGTGDITVFGDATFSGGSMTFFSLAVIAVAGDVTFNGTSATSPPNLRCAGDWISDAAFNATLSTVTFDGVGMQSVTTTGTTFFRVIVGPQSLVTTAAAFHCRSRLLVDGQLTATGVLDLDGEFEINGTVNALSPMDVEGNATVAASGTLMAGALTHDFGGNVTLDGAYLHSGTMRLDGGGTVSSSGGSTIPDVVVANAGSNVILSAPLTVTGDCDKTGAGVFAIGGTGSVSVGGNATMSDGSLSFFSSAFLDVAGDVTFNGCAAVSPPTIRCGGSWDSDAAFDSIFNSVILAAVGAQSFAHAGSTFNGLEVEPLAVINDSTPLACRAAVVVDGSFSTSATMHFIGSVQVNGTLATTSTVDFDGAVTVAPGGHLDLGSGLHTVGGAFDVMGALTLTSILEFDGQGLVRVPGTPLPGVYVNATGTVTFHGPMTINGDLEADSGGVFNGGSGDVVITGDLDLEGVSISIAGSAFDVAGDVTVQNVVGSHIMTVRCAGDFRADGTFTPSGGVIHLDGPTATTFGAIGGNVLTVSQLRIQNARRFPEAAMELDAPSGVFVETGGELALQGRDLDVVRGNIAVDGLLDLAAGDRLGLGGAAGVTVASSGSLVMNGTVGNPVRVVGYMGGGYGFSVAGSLAAMNFEFHEVGVQGVRIVGSATIAAPPFDLRGGLFDNPTAGPQSVLLDLNRAAGTEFRFLTFQNSNGLGTFNARSVAGTVTLRNWSGAFGGPAFEDDPQSRLDWGVPDVTTVSSFDLRPLGERIRARFTTMNEIDAVRFDLERALSAAGPYVLVASFTPQGAGTEYLVEDAPLTAGQTYFYRVVEELTHGATQVFASGTAVPLAISPPANFLTVGPNGTFADIQSAVNAATDPRSVVLVEGGTYPAFTVNGSTITDLRVLAEAGQVVAIDTTTGPVTIQNVPLGITVELDGLVIGSSASSNGGAIVTGCGGTILLTDCDVTGGTGTPGVAIDTSTAAVIQGCMTSGSPAVRADLGSRAIVGDTVLASLEIRGNSIVTTSGATPGNVVVDPGSTHDALAGTRPRIGVPDLVTLGDPFTITIEVDPAQLWVLFFSTQARWFDFGSLAVEAGALVDPVGVGISLVAVRHADGLGMDSQLVQVAQAPSVLGFKGVFQVATYESSLSRYRWSNLASTNIVP